MQDELHEFRRVIDDLKLQRVIDDEHLNQIAKMESNLRAVGYVLAAWMVIEHWPDPVIVGGVLIFDAVMIYDLWRKWRWLRQRAK